MTRKRKRPQLPPIFNWVARGYYDFVDQTPYKHAPIKGLESLPRDQWTPEAEQYCDGLNSARDDYQRGYLTLDPLTKGSINDS